ncbi:prepilin peptidase [Streptomyces ardesiacus]|uniref:prepilin peptidase n=1 Tax=Streptomyces ardesiacus TaxID=285564 RepID=UPI00201F7B56|nr:A24 family peptidase [Streptomyces ardesiacus]MCL7366306.1 A24 family peptidase [Streptomyces ardesiacus]
MSTATGLDSDLVVVLVAALWGAATGALLPRAAYRFSAPAGEAWRERCPGGHPVRGWLGRARCGQCAAGESGHSGEFGRSEQSGHSGESGRSGESRRPGRSGREPGQPRRSADARYGPRTAPLALVTALVCAALAAATGTRPEVAVWLLLAPVGVLLAAVDLKVRRLPDPLTLPLAGAALVLLGLAALVPEHAGEWSTALLGALVLGAGYLVLFLVNPAGMGFGDVKLALAAGAVLGWYGWPTLMLGTFAGFLLGALYGGALLVARRADRKTAIPFGPFLVAGAFLGILAGAYAA